MSSEPYVLAYVPLAEGLVLTNIVDSDPAALAIGTRVKVELESTSGEAVFPLFVAAYIVVSNDRAAHCCWQLFNGLA